jgi:CHAT domain-containing protein
MLNLTASGTAQARPRSVLAVGNPAGGEALPEAAAEARSVASLYPEHVLLVDRDAAEAVAKRELPRHEVIHFAGHAVADALAPMYSALLLAPGGTDSDGRLEAWEVAKLRLHARVAVLSACDTGNGSVYPGEGIVGLSWAFLLAGCRTTVVSQWRVRSDAAAALMVEFHRRLLAGDRPSTAMRKAALLLRSRTEFRHPADWAAFVVVGAP